MARLSSQHALGESPPARWTSASKVRRRSSSTPEVYNARRFADAAAEIHPLHFLQANVSRGVETMPVLRARHRARPTGTAIPPLHGPQGARVRAADGQNRKPRTSAGRGAPAAWRSPATPARPPARRTPAATKAAEATAAEGAAATFATSAPAAAAGSPSPSIRAAVVAPTAPSPGTRRIGRCPTTAGRPAAATSAPPATAPAATAVSAGTATTASPATGRRVHRRRPQEASLPSPPPRWWGRWCGGRRWRWRWGAEGRVGRGTSRGSGIPYPSF